jgi:NADPH:quinone reductase-like Zn-dependent oxidoreductase
LIFKVINYKVKAITLVKNGEAATAFETREIPKPVAGADEVLIKVAAIGLNFADVMARRGMYKEAPPIPAVLGYDVAGTIEGTGKNVTHLKVGDRVTALTRFGGYAEYAVTNATAVAVLPSNIDNASATALTTQYCTAYYAAAELVNLFAGDKVLIHAGAGGVGTALIQYAKYKECEIFATAGSEEKLNYLASQGVHHPINYRTHDFKKEVEKLTNRQDVDVVFDPVGGSSVKKGVQLLATGGRIVCYGASDMLSKNAFGKLKSGLAFGFYHPAMFIRPSKSMIGINMLQVADHKPMIINRCLQQVMKLSKEGVFKPVIAKVFKAGELALAHEYLESRKSIGKVVVEW